MTASPLPPGRALEEAVADYYRKFGAAKVVVNEMLAGNQIDVYVEEETSSGSRVRMILECKDLHGSVGIARVNKFVAVVETLRHRNMMDHAVMVTASGYSKEARDAARVHEIRLLTISDLAERLERMQSVRLLTIARDELFVALSREGRLRAAPVLAATDPTNPLLAQKVKLFAEYIMECERLSADPDGGVIALDISGPASQFANWATNSLYHGLLQANGGYVAAYRRIHGLKGVPFRRTFVVDPATLTEQGIADFQRTLELHAYYGIITGVILRRPSIPGDVLGDLANLADRVCVDFGNLEGYDSGTPSLLDIVAPAGATQFRRIRDRAAWTTLPGNVDMEVRRPEEINEIVRAVDALRRRA